MVLVFGQILEPLKKLQDLDLELHRLSLRKRAIPARLVDFEHEVAKLHEEIQEFENKHKETKLALAKRELELKEKGEHLRKFQTQADQAKTNKEYQTLMHEMGAVKADVRKIEDEALEVMTALEGMERKIAERKKQLGIEETDLKRARQEVESELASLESDERGLADTRTRATSGLEIEVLGLYERILHAKQDGIVLALVLDGICQACNRGLTAQEVNQLMIKRDVTTCKSCSRILYI